MSYIIIFLISGFAIYLIHNQNSVKKFSGLLAFVLLVAGCNSTSQKAVVEKSDVCTTRSYRNIGTFIGAVTGGLLLAPFGGGLGQIALTSAGVLAGASLGNVMGKEMGHGEKAYQSSKIDRYSMPGVVTLVEPSECRSFAQEVMMDGKKTIIYSTACKMPAGHWQQLPMMTEIITVNKK